MDEETKKILVGIKTRVGAELGKMVNAGKLNGTKASKVVDALDNCLGGEETPPPAPIISRPRGRTDDLEDFTRDLRKGL